ncbi:MAG: hypothetical protein QXN59_02400 [Candidatus Micrarchaeaceae archaeon]
METKSFSLEDGTVEMALGYAPKIGIERMVISVPSIGIRSEDLERELGFGAGKISGGLKINEIRLPGPTESNATMVANALYDFIKNIASDNGAMSKLRKEPIRSIYFSTESSPDRSRPELEPALLMVSSMLSLEGRQYEEIIDMLKRARTVPITYACVGGMLALGDAANEVALGVYRSEPGSSLVIAVDTSVYSNHRAKNAEGTQGAASALMWITSNPSLATVSIESRPTSFHGAFADFTKYGEETPLVHANFSKIMYVYAVAEALEGFENSKRGFNLDDMDFFIAHVPFPKQTEYFLGFLYAHYLRTYNRDLLNEIEHRDGVGMEPLHGYLGFTDMMRGKIKEFNSESNLSENEFVKRIEDDKWIWEYWEWTGSLRKQPEFAKFKKRFMIDMALEKPSLIGNSYSASVFVSLASLLSSVEGSGKELHGIIVGYGSGAQAVCHQLEINALQKSYGGKLLIDMGKPFYICGSSYRKLHDELLVHGEARRMIRGKDDEDLAIIEKQLLGSAALANGFHVRRKNPDGTGEYFFVTEDGKEVNIPIRV